MPKFKLRQALIWARDTLKRAKDPEFGVDAEVLLADILGCQRLGVYLKSEEPFSQEDWKKYQKWILRRVEGEPVAYITGRTEFLGLSLKINSHVFIPRPETELLVEKVLKDLASVKGETWVVDVGTGSGNIAISLLCQKPGLHMVAIDQDAKALTLAKKNAKRYRLEKCILFFKGDFLSLLRDRRHLQIPNFFGAIVANLPYVAKRDLSRLPWEVQREPKTALDGGEKGLEKLKDLIKQAPSYLQPGGHLYLEIGEGQARYLFPLLKQQGFKKIEILKDYQNIDRIVVGEWTNS